VHPPAGGGTHSRSQEFWLLLRPKVTKKINSGVINCAQSKGDLNQITSNHHPFERGGINQFK
jgi:hypothetical protein